MSEQERARKFVERHFPVTAAFLAAARGEGPAPVYGPSSVQNAHDDQPEPHVVVRVAYQLSRWELMAALAAGYATSNTGVNPDEMTVSQIRYDVEAQLSLMSWQDMDRLVEEVAGQIERGEHPRQMEALRRAADRAYPTVPVPDERRVQRPEYGPGTVALDTDDHGRITVAEPVWCAGHDGQMVGLREEISHVSPAVVGEFAGVEFLHACISSGPFAAVQPEPMGDVDEFPGMTPDELRGLAAEVGLHAGRLYSLANQLDRIRRGMS